MNTLRTSLLRAPLAGACLLVLTCSPRVAAAEPTDTATTAAAQDLDTAATKHGDAKVISGITEKFSGLAGSTDNATALVTGLRDGSEIKLSSTVNGTTQTAAFQPATGKQGYGNVFLSLALAQSDLAEAGIAHPTAEQLQAALNGGPVTVGDTTTTLDGVLKLRADGQGWGQIARTLGVRLGSVVSELHSARARAENPDRPEGVGRPEKPGRPDKAERPARPDRPERSEFPARPERPERAAMPSRPERPERGNR
jgi:hypothetical protein